MERPPRRTRTRRMVALRVHFMGHQRDSARTQTGPSRVTPTDPNAGQGEVATGFTHGTANGYQNHGCRCAPCRMAWRIYYSELRAAKTGLPEGDPRHGTLSGYQYHRCRCEACTTAVREADKRWPKSQRKHVRRSTAEHGTRSRYNYGCRCTECTKAATDYANLQRTGLPTGDPRHGTQAGYSKGCRCSACRIAHNEYNREWWARRRPQRVPKAPDRERGPGSERSTTMSDEDTKPEVDETAESEVAQTEDEDQAAE